MAKQWHKMPENFAKKWKNRVFLDSMVGKLAPLQVRTTDNFYSMTIKDIKDSI